MKRYSVVRLSLGIAVGAVALVAGLVGSQVSAASETISIGSAIIAPGGQGSVELQAIDIAEPGLGAWSVDIVYDPTVVTAIACSAEHGGVCNPAFAADTVRIAGATATGLAGDSTLGSITFECGESEGSSALELTVQTLADATGGAPQDIVAATVDGSVSCQAEPAIVRVGSATAPLGGQASVDLDALSVAAPGLGAWSIDVTYDPTVATAVGCSPLTGSVCNEAFDDDAVRVTGANADGLDGDTTLAAITFQCGSAEGVSALTLSLQVFVDATIGDPRPIATITQNGTFTCAAAPTPTVTATPGATAAPTPTPTPTTAAPGLPTAGAGGGAGWDNGNPVGWLIAGLAGAGIAWLIAAATGARFAPITGSGPLRPRATAARGEAEASAVFQPKMKPLGTASGAARRGGATAIPTSHAVGPSDTRVDTAGSNSGRRR